MKIKYLIIVTSDIAQDKRTNALSKTYKILSLDKCAVHTLVYHLKNIFERFSHT